MDISQYLYIVILIAGLATMTAAWIIARRRHPGARIEPAMGPAENFEEDVSGTEMGQSFDDVPSPDPDTSAPARKTLSLTTDKGPDRMFERDYKGFKIRVREKRPGIWVASVTDQVPGNRKKPAEARKIAITDEYYQEPAAIAEAEVMIDRLSRVAARR